MYDATQLANRHPKLGRALYRVALRIHQKTEKKAPTPRR